MEPRGKAIFRAPVTDSGGRNAEARHQSLISAETIYQLGSGEVLHAAFYSGHLEPVKGPEPELRSRYDCGLIDGVKNQSEKSIPAIAERLRVTREALGINQAELCRRTGVATNTYNQYESAKGRPELDKAILLAEGLGLTLDWIYRGDPSALPHGLAVAIAEQQKRRSLRRA